MNDAVKLIMALLVIAVIILISMVSAQNRNERKRDQMREIAEELDIEVEGLIEADYMFGD